MEGIEEIKTVPKGKGKPALETKRTGEGKKASEAFLSSFHCLCSPLLI